jgi:hypothetical protein
VGTALISILLATTTTMRTIQLLTPIALALTVRAVAVPTALDARQVNAPGCTVALWAQCGGLCEYGAVWRLLGSGSRM